MSNVRKFESKDDAAKPYQHLHLNNIPELQFFNISH